MHLVPRGLTPDKSFSCKSQRYTAPPPKSLIQESFTVNLRPGIYLLQPRRRGAFSLAALHWTAEGGRPHTSCYGFIISGTRVAGGVLRLRWMLTAPSMTTMPTPGKSPF